MHLGVLIERYSAQMHFWFLTASGRRSSTFLVSERLWLKKKRISCFFERVMLRKHIPVPSQWIQNCAGLRGRRVRFPQLKIFISWSRLEVINKTWPLHCKKKKWICLPFSASYRSLRNDIGFYLMETNFLPNEIADFPKSGAWSAQKSNCMLFYFCIKGGRVQTKTVFFLKIQSCFKKMSYRSCQWVKNCIALKGSQLHL